MATAPLARYHAKRDFEKTPEPAGEHAEGGERLSFVIQKHWASHLHYDFRLELDGVLVSWAVPKGPSFDPAVKRMAIHVEDHPVSYGSFEGRIPEKQYGAGTVIVWDRGTWQPVGDPQAGLRSGKLVFALSGEKLAGQWELVRIAKPGDRQEAWLLFKKRDAFARASADYDVVAALPDSVVEKPLGLAEARGDAPAPLRSNVPAPAAARVAAPKTKRASRAVKASEHAASPATADGPPEGAVPSKLPATLSPQLATLVKEPPAGDDWAVEAKFDGYRVLARIAKGKARIVTRNGNDWTDKLGSVAAAVETLGLDEAWLDGEIVVLKDDGGQDFNALQNAIDHHKNESIVYFLFDAPFLAGYDLRRVPLHARRAALAHVVERAGDDRIRFSADFPSSPAEVLKAACAMHFEGVIAKRRDSHYASTRNDDWIKLKCSLRQEFVIGGYSDRANSKTEIGNLFLGVYEDGKLRYAGAMGTGWTLAVARELKEKLAKLETERSPFEIGSVKQTRWSKRVPGSERWVKPVLVAEVAFAEWTPDGHLRHPSFQGLREDKPAKSVVRERPADAPNEAPIAEATTPKRRATATATAKVGTADRPATKKSASSTKAVPSAKATVAAKGGALVAGVRVSSPERVIDATSGATKVDLVRYYDSVADRILPHLEGRPVSLVRGPSGVGGELFFQKHLEAKIAGMTELDAKLWPGHASMMAVNTHEALLSAAQMNTIEFHTWNARSKTIDRPDRMIFDLDPGEGVTWAQVQEAATLVHGLLDELGLVAFLKTSGGKGLHVVVPLAPRADWDAVKGFSQAVVQHMAKTIPDRFVAKPGGANRVGRIFIDYIRNGLGATTAVAFSARARPGLGVSVPVAWEDLPALKSGAQWTIATAREYLSFEKRDPWASYASTKQTLAAAMKTLGYPAGKR